MSVAAPSARTRIGLGSNPNLAAVDWTPSPRPASLRPIDEESSLPGDDTVVDNPYDLPDDLEERISVDDLAETIALSPRSADSFKARGRRELAEQSTALATTAANDADPLKHTAEMVPAERHRNLEVPALARPVPAASLPGFRPPADLVATITTAAPEAASVSLPTPEAPEPPLPVEPDSAPPIDAAWLDVPALAPPPRMPTNLAPERRWWGQPRVHWVVGAVAFLLSGGLWALFAWLLLGKH